MGLKGRPSRPAVACVRHAAITDCRKLSVEGDKTGVSTYAITLMLIFMTVPGSVLVML
jgi:hypothetical protein